jgi:TrmH family RNA methyltransferase
MLGVQTHCIVEPLSDKNPLVKQIRRAVSRGTLTEEGYAVAEGVHLVEEALASGLEIAAVIAAESARQRYPDARVVTAKTFRELASTETPQGVLALVRPPRWTAEELIRGDTLVIVLDGIQEPGNAGAIVRACEAFGATGAVFLKGTVYPYNPKCVRGSAGSIFRVPVLAGDDAEQFIRRDIPLFAAMPKAELAVSAADLRQPCGIVIGSEGRGVSPALAGKATPVRIPTSGVESLNAAVAAGIILYEARRQRAASAARGGDS